MLDLACMAGEASIPACNINFSGEDPEAGAPPRRYSLPSFLSSRRLLAARPMRRIRDPGSRRVREWRRRRRFTAATRSGTTWARTMYAGWHVTRHTCAILGRMLAMPGLIRHLEEMADLLLPEVLSYDFYSHEVLVHAISLENWGVSPGN